MKKYDTRKNVTVDSETLRQWQVLAEHSATNESALLRKLIRDAYAQLGKGKETMTVTNSSGKSLNFDAAVNMMDDELREAVHGDLAPCTNQEFFTAYEKAHAAKFGEEWELSKRNPTW